jgi:hypothetical protein
MSPPKPHFKSVKDHIKNMKKAAEGGQNNMKSTIKKPEGILYDTDFSVSEDEDEDGDGKDVSLDTLGFP